jgi:nicotinamidase-related amidase
LIIDMQRDFCEPHGYLALQGYDIAGTRRIIPNIAAIRETCRDWGALVIYTREGHRPDLSDLPAQKAWRSRQAGIGIGAAGPLGRLLVRGEPGCEIIAELTPGTDEIVIDKPGYSAFHATDLDLILRARGIRHLILTGVTTDVCVHSTLREAVDRGFECLTIADACAASLEETHAAAIRTIMTEGGIFGAVTTTGEVCVALSSHALPA